jgi:hypothetical protein
VSSRRPLAILVNNAVVIWRHKALAPGATIREFPEHRSTVRPLRKIYPGVAQQMSATGVTD